METQQATSTNDLVKLAFCPLPQAGAVLQRLRRGPGWDILLQRYAARFGGRSLQLGRFKRLVSKVSACSMGEHSRGRPADRVPDRLSHPSAQWLTITERSALKMREVF